MYKEPLAVAQQPPYKLIPICMAGKGSSSDRRKPLGNPSLTRNKAVPLDKHLMVGHQSCNARQDGSFTSTENIQDARKHTPAKNSITGGRVAGTRWKRMSVVDINAGCWIGLTVFS